MGWTEVNVGDVEDLTHVFEAFSIRGGPDLAPLVPSGSDHVFAQQTVDLL